MGFNTLTPGEICVLPVLDVIVYGQCDAGTQGSGHRQTLDVSYIVRHS